MGLNVRIYNISSPNPFTLSYKSGDTPGDVSSGFTNYGGTYQSSLVRDYYNNPIIVTGLTFDTHYWIKIVDTVTNNYIIEDIYTNVKEFYKCFVITPTPTPSPSPSSTPTDTPTSTPTPTPTSTTVPPTPSSTVPPPTPTPTPTPSSTVPPTATPTSTPTPTPTGEVSGYPFTLQYTSSSTNGIDACSVSGNEFTFYSADSVLTNGSVLYTSSLLQGFALAGSYSNGTNYYAITGNTGVIVTAGMCPTQPPPSYTINLILSGSTDLNRTMEVYKSVNQNDSNTYQLAATLNSVNGSNVTSSITGEANYYYYFKITMGNTNKLKITSTVSGVNNYSNCISTTIGTPILLPYPYSGGDITFEGIVNDSSCI
jgi:hypothetical protein